MYVKWWSQLNMHIKWRCSQSSECVFKSRCVPISSCHFCCQPKIKSCQGLVTIPKGVFKIGFFTLYRPYGCPTCAIVGPAGITTAGISLYKDCFYGNLYVTYKSHIFTLWSDSLYVILYLMYKLLYKYFLHLKYKEHLYLSFYVKYRYLA